MYFSGRAEVTSGEMREAEKRGPRVEWDMFASPVVAAGDCHIMVAAAAEEEEEEGGQMDNGRVCLLMSCALKLGVGN